ncbi:MAG: hypothetical protein OXR73_06840 [Myxococcales bacterium]|nr:hypothetical protein [Myxococcales bacterium]
MSEGTSKFHKPVMIPADNPWAHRWKITAGMAAVGGALALFGAINDAHRFAFSWLFAFCAVMTMALGAIFFVLIQHLTGAGWSVTVRRTAEFYARGIWMVVALVVPIMVMAPTLYPWWDASGGHGDHGVAHAQDHGGEHAEEAHGAAGHAAGAHAGSHGEHTPEHQFHADILQKKLGYLDGGAFFGIRAVIYMMVWVWLGAWILGLSTKQDRTKDKQLTVEMARRATYGTFLYALSLTFAGFDWVMSLEPNWYSTMFGVRIFASGAVLSFALVILTTKSFKRHGVVGSQINTEHYHDLGKLMFGFLVFWAYISFSEFFLIWYAAIPEETIYYHRRWDTDSWRLVSSSLVLFKFIVPFYLVMSRNVKRHTGGLWLGAAWLVTMHFVEMYYWVMPYAADLQGVPATPAGLASDVGCLMTTVGLYLTYVFWEMTRHSVIAVGDPRLERSLQFVNA